MTFSDKLIALRKKAGWSQEELAERLNVSRQSVSKWESAQSMPDIDKILQLSSLFSVTTDCLLKDTQAEPEYTEDDTSPLPRIKALTAPTGWWWLPSSCGTPSAPTATASRSTAGSSGPLRAWSTPRVWLRQRRLCGKKCKDNSP